MGKYRLVGIVGTRPQYIKAAMLEQELNAHGLSQFIIHTGQHYDKRMAKDYYKDFIEPDAVLTTGGTLKTMKRLIKDYLQPNDVVIVYGDCRSTLAGAEAAVELGVRVIHVEAGLRCGNTHMPEEQIRIEVDHIAVLNFCPTKYSFITLNKELKNTEANHCFLTGDLMLDAFLKYHKPSENEGFIYCTLHRYGANYLAQIETICSEAVRHDTKVIMPIHPRHNPAYEYLKKLPRLEVIEPVGYEDSLTLLSKCEKVITDSGGLQREAYWQGKQCIVMRNETEWGECGHTLANVGTIKKRLLEKHLVVEQDSTRFFKFGNGQAAESMVRIIQQML